MKLYCYLESANGGYDVFEYTQSGKFVFHSHFSSEFDAYDAISKLSK